MALQNRQGSPHQTDGCSIEVRLLNGFEVNDDLGRLEIPAVGARLIAYLALQQRQVRRCAVAGALWPDTTQEKAQASLRSTLWRIRKVDNGIIHSTHECVMLDDAVDVDTQAVLNGTQRLYEGDDDPDPRHLILSLSSELLPDWYDDWVIFERERFRLIALNALERISCTFTERSNFANAVEYALAAVRLEPLRESAHRALISAHIAQGNIGEALRQYRLYKELVLTELGIGPSSQMSDLLTYAGLRKDVVNARSAA